MASLPVGPLSARKSFAQVAAAAHKPILGARQSPSENTGPVLKSAEDDGQTAHQQLTTKHQPHIEEGPVPHPVTTDPLLKNRSNEQLEASQAPSTLPSDSGHLQLDGLQRREHSDTKSVASRTTLTLDEKESLRPDDSASVQAAVEEDSPVGSRVGSASDPDARAFRDQLHEIERNGPSRYLAQRNLPAALPRSAQQSGLQGFGGPTAAVPHQNHVLDSEAQGRQSGPPPGHALPPDEKLLEALASPKDRLFVLKIEQDMIDFVKDSKENFLQLPQTNSFYRMLSHKLADYYCLSHVVDESLTSVRIYRTPHCRLPPPLIGPDPATGGSTPPPVAPARKIMRRGDTDEAMMSLNGAQDQSKTTSELDASESEDNQRDKATMTREERENRYKEARARIFKDFKEGSAGPSETASPSNEADHSRSSSRSGLRKTKKSRKPKDDTFEARSAYSQFPSQHFVQTGFQQAPQDSLYHAFASLNVSGPYTSSPAGYSPASPAYNDGANTHQASVHGSQWYPQAYPQQYAMAQSMGASGHYPPPHDGQANGSFSGFHPYQSPSQATPKATAPSLVYGSPSFSQGQVQQGPGWSQPQYGQPYSMPPLYPGQQPPGGSMQPGGQMAYGYQPAQAEMGFYGQHGRGPFNPNSQSFVPSMPGNMMGMPGQFIQSQQFQPASHQQASLGNGFVLRQSVTSPGNQKMQRKASNLSHTSGFIQGLSPQQPHQKQGNAPRAPPQQQQQQQQQLHQSPQPQPQHAQQPSIRDSGAYASQGQQQLPNTSTISKWANSASLPSKPPAPASSLAFQIPQNSVGKQPLPVNPIAASMTASRTDSSTNGHGLSGNRE